MVPVLVQLKTWNVLESSPSLSSSKAQHQFYIEKEYLPEGVEDAVVLGPALVWRENNAWKICLHGKVYANEKSEGMVTINNVDKTLVVDGNVVKPESTADTITTLKVFKGMLEHNNQSAAAILADFAKPSVQKALLVEACIHGPVDLVDKIMGKTKMNPDSVIYGSFGTPLNIAAINGQDAVVSCLVEKHKANVYFKPPKG